MGFSAGITFTQASGVFQNVAERNASHVEMMRRQEDNLSATIRVAIPAKVVSFDANKQTIVAQPLIREQIIDRSSGSLSFVQLPQIPDVPVSFIQAGNFILTMPITVGDECLLLFNDMCIDSWWAQGDIQNWNDRRRHDLSDAVAIFGINSVPNVITNIATDAAELRHKDGHTTITIKNQDVKITPDSGTTFVHITPTNIELTATTVNINGTLNHNNHDITRHYHGGVTGGSSNTNRMTED